MPWTLTERIESRNRSGGSVTRRFRLVGTSDDVEALAQLLAATPATYDGLTRESNPTIEPIYVDETGDVGEWDCTVKYNPSSGRVRVFDTTPTEIGEVVLAIDMTGGTQHILQSLATSARIPAATAPDYKGAIGVTKDAVDGCDIIIPVFNFTAMKVFSGNAPASLPDIGDLYQLTGKVNDSPFTITGSLSNPGGPQTTLRFQAGEVVFRGPSIGGAEREDGGIEIQFGFSAAENRENITVGPLSGIDKKGWEYLWIRYQDEVDEDRNALVKRPVAAYVEKVYREGPFALLYLS